MIPDTIRSYRCPAEGLRDRTVMITGAGQGLGKQLALTAARLGARLILHGRSSAKLEQLDDEIRAQAAQDPVLLPLDLSQAQDHDFAQMAGAIDAQFGQLHALVHCAADLDLPAPFEQQELEAWMRSLRVNLAAPVAMTRACVRLLRKSGDGSVIFTGESHGLRPAPFWGAFAAAKSALTHATQSFAQESESDARLRINMIVPGVIDSPQRSKTHPGELKSERRPIDSVLPAYLYLMGPASRGTTGQILEF